MNKYKQTILLFLIILAIELAPFLYKEAYSLEEINWISASVIPLAVFGWLSYKEYKSKKNEK
jgi:hypothetical protein